MSRGHGFNPPRLRLLQHQPSAWTSYFMMTMETPLTMVKFSLFHRLLVSPRVCSMLTTMKSTLPERRVPICAVTAMRLKG